MTRRTAARLGWSLVLVSMGLYAASLALGLTREPVRAVGETEAAAQDAVFVAAFVVFGVAGALIVSRHPRNAIGWLFVGLGFVQALNAFVFEYAVRAEFVAPGSLPLGPEAAWLGGWLWVSTIVFLIFLLLLFPDGRLPSLFSRVVAWATLASSFLAVAGAVLVWPHREEFFLARGEPPGIGGDIAEIGFGVLLPLGAVAIVAVVVRFIRSRGEERLQLKWFAFAAGLVGVDLVLSEFDLVSGTALRFLDLVAILSIPVAVAIAVLKYRLYDIDVVINRTLVYGGLAAFITAAYVGVVVGLGNMIGTRGEPNLGLQVGATALVAVGFQPVRSRVQRLANRLVYGRRASPYETLAAVASQAGGTYATEDVLPRLARVVAEGTGAREARVWLRVGDELRPAASFPPGDGEGGGLALPGDGVPEIPGATRALPVTHGDDLLGALSMTKAPGDALRPEEDRLLGDLADQAGHVLRNVRLTEDLRAHLAEIETQAEALQESRRRLVATHDAERRRLERDIHDGAQQHLVALAVNLRLARALAEKDPSMARPQLELLRDRTDEALETLRDLARGIYPPLLEREGLGPAVRAEAERSPVPVEVEDADLPRLAPGVEAAAYFSCLEALQNVAKYAEATRTVVRLSREDGDLVFSVEDDGRGFDPQATPPGTGLTNIADRLRALGGSLEVRSAPGRGTGVAGRIPVPAEVRV